MPNGAARLFVTLLFLAGLPWLLLNPNGARALMEEVWPTDRISEFTGYGKTNCSDGPIRHGSPLLLYNKYGGTIRGFYPMKTNLIPPPYCYRGHSLTHYAQSEYFDCMNYVGG